MPPAPRRPASALLLIAALLYGGALIAWHALGLTRFAGAWVYHLADIFSLWLYLPLPPLALLVAARRDWRAGLGLVAPLLAFGVEYGALALPRERSESGQAGAGPPLRVMTANLKAQDGGGDLAAALLAARPDVLAVQELDPALSTALGERLRAAYPYQALWPSASEASLGVFSRYPLRPEGALDGCPCQQVAVEPGGQPITVLNVHPDSPKVTYRLVGPVPIPTGFDTSAQDAAVQRILGRASGIDAPLLVVGDFNVSDREPSYRLLRRRLGDAYRSVGPGLGYTFPTSDFAELPSRLRSLPLFPLVRIDYVLYSEQWVPSRARTVALPGTDHLSLVADLALAAPAG